MRCGSIPPIPTDRSWAAIRANGGKAWSSWFNQPTAQIYHVATDNRFPYWVYGAQQDSGAVSLSSRTDTYDGITMEQFHEETAGGESGMIAPDPNDPDIIYGEKVQKLDLKSGQTREVDPTLAYPAAEYRSAWTLPLVFSKRDKKTLYFANQRLFRTSDGGNHWAAMSPDLTREDAGVPSNLDATTAVDDDHLSKRRGVIYTIAPSPLRAGVLWIGTDDGLVWRTDDNGAHWAQVTPPALLPWSKIGGIDLSHFDPNVAYAAIDRHRLDDDAPYIWRTGDGGKTWAAIDTGLPADAFVNVVREDPAKKGLLYAGAERGMFVSFDDGAHWQSLEQNLPMTSVRDIDVHGDDLVIATHGRGFWIMDDVTALRQVATVASAPVLFKPADAIRMRSASFTGTPMPKDEPMAANPPDGAAIDFVLPASVSGPVTLTVLDTKNQKVTSYTSAEKPHAPDAAKLPFAPEWVPPHPILPATPGMHRFMWDLHYPSGEPSENPFRSGGVWAPPGSYWVALSVNGQTLRQPLTVKSDPRVKIAPAALVREFQLAMQVQKTSAQNTAALKEATALMKALGERAAHETKLRPQMLHAMSSIGVLSDVPLPSNVHPGRANPPARADSFRSLADDFEKLEAAIDGADADPSTDAKASYATLSKILAATLKQWQTLKTGEIAALNSALTAAGEKSAHGN
jgi:hypothetical protein